MNQQMVWQIKFLCKQHQHVYTAAHAHTDTSAVHGREQTHLTTAQKVRGGRMTHNQTMRKA